MAGKVCYVKCTCHVVAVTCTKYTVEISRYCFIDVLIDIAVE